MYNIIMNLADYIRICCVRKAMSLAELARATGISPQNLSNKISRNKFSNEDLDAIAKAFNASLEIAFIDNVTGRKIKD